MATEIRAFNPTIPAGTLQNVPTTIDLSFPSRIVEAIEITIPPGANGLVGFLLASGGQQIIPFAAGSWFIGSGQVKRWELVDQITTGAWQLIAYNTGRYDHQLLIDFHLAYLNTLTPQPIQPIPVSSLQPIVTADTIASSLPVMQ